MAWKIVEGDPFADELDFEDLKKKQEAAKPKPPANTSDLLKYGEAYSPFQAFGQTVESPESVFKEPTPKRPEGMAALADPQQYAEVAKGVPQGAVSFVGTTLQGAGAVPATAQANIQKNAQARIAMLDRLDRGEAPTPKRFGDLTSMASLSDDYGYRSLSPEQRAAERQKLQGQLSAYRPTPLAEQPLYKAGGAVQDYAKTILPAAPGYEDAFGRQIGEGLGSLIAGLPFGVAGRIPGTIFFGAGGMGEAGTRAIAYDQAEKRAGRPGLTQDQINTAALYGVGPGTTDMLPVEALLGRLHVPTPGRKALAQAIGRIGGQAFIEGMQEGGQQFLQNLIAKGVYKPDQSLTDDVRANAEVGGAVGGVAEAAKEVGGSLWQRLLGRRGHAVGARPEAGGAAADPFAQPLTPAPGGEGVTISRPEPIDVTFEDLIPPERRLPRPEEPAPQAGLEPPPLPSPAPQAAPQVLPAAQAVEAAPVPPALRQSVMAETLRQAQAMPQVAGLLQAEQQRTGETVEQVFDRLVTSGPVAQQYAQTAANLAMTGQASRAAQPLVQALSAELAKPVEMREQFGGDTNAVTTRMAPNAQTEVGTVPESLPMPSGSFSTQDVLYALGAPQGSRDDLGYTSKAVDAANALQRKSGPSAGFLNDLTKAGVTKNELQATGLDKFLAERPSVTKQEIVDFLEQNRVGLQETTYGGDLDQIAQRIYGKPYAQLSRNEQGWVNAEVEIPKWSEYSLDPANPTYRETLINIPEKTAAREAHDTEERRLNRKYWDERRVHWTAAATPEERAEMDRLQGEMLKENERNVKNAYQSGHWRDTPNVVAHTRTALFQDTQGRQVFNIDELQSDWGQKIREGGTRDEEKIADLKRRHAEIRPALSSAIEEAKSALSAVDHLGFDNWNQALRAVRQHPDWRQRWDVSEEEAAPIQRYVDLVKQESLIDAEIRTAEAAAPSHPLVNTTDQWVTTAMRRLIQQAADSGADGISITPAKVQNERFSLSNQGITGLAFAENERGTLGDLLIERSHGRWEVIKEGIEPRELPDYVGKEMAENLMKQPEEDTAFGYYARTLRDLPNIEIGGEGMKATYDGLYPSVLGKLLKKLDPSIKAEKTHIKKHGSKVPHGTELDWQDKLKGTPTEFTFFPLTEKAKQKLADEGQPMFALGASNGRDQRPGDGARRSESGSLAPLKGAPAVAGATGPDPRIVAAAEQYARANGIPLKRQAFFAEVNEGLATRIAGAYDAMAHNPADPKVRAAYDDMIQQTIAQHQALVDAGYQFFFYDESNDPYAGNPWNSIRDLRSNQRMGVFATEAGFGSGVTDLNTDDSPMLADTGIEWPYGSLDGPKKRVLANDLFRAVHDAFGHSMEGAGFRARGEENAWQAHIRLYKGLAVGAVTSETRGQNSWLNFGPYGEANRNASVEDTVFADQKIGLMPEWTWREGRAPDEDDTSFALQGFYSPAIRATEKLKQEKATPEQWWSMISKTPGVRQEELQWMGLKEWLDSFKDQGDPNQLSFPFLSSKDKNSIARADVLRFMQAHQMELDDILLKSDDVDNEEKEEWIQDRADSIFYDLESEAVSEEMEEWRRNNEPDYEISTLQDEDRRLENERRLEAGEDEIETWFFTLEDKNNNKDTYDSAEKDEFFYSEHSARQAAVAQREDLMSEFEDEEETERQSIYEDERSALRDEAYGQAARAWQEEKGEEGAGETQFKSYAIPGGSEYRELLIRMPYLYDQGYSSPHFDDYEVVHLRFDTREGPDGDRVMFIHEIQSDLHQRARKKGYRSPDSDQRLEDAVNARTDQHKIAFQQLLSTLQKQGVFTVDVPQGGDVSEPYSIRYFVVPNPAVENIPEAPPYLGMSKSSHKSDPESFGSFPYRTLDKFAEDVLGKLEGNGLVRHAFPQLAAAFEVAAQEAKNANSSFPDAPYKGNAWWELGFKRMVQYAVENNFDAIALTTPTQISNASMTPTAVAQKFYGENVPRFIEKYLKKWGVKPERAGLSGLHLGPEGRNPYYRITDAMREDVQSGGQPLALGPASPKSDVALRSSIGSMVKLGRTVSVPYADAVLDVTKPYLPMLPSGVPVAALSKVAPVPGQKGRVIATFKTHDGQTLELEGPYRDLSTRRAWFGGDGLGGRAVFLPRFNAVGSGDPLIIGEMRHEAVHALRQAAALPGAIWGRLLDHAKQLRLLDSDFKTYLQRIGSPNAKDAPDGVTILELYEDAYKGYRSYQESIDQEYVAHLAELYSHGELLPQEVAPVKEILDDIFAGKYSKSVPAQREVTEAAAFAGPWAQTAKQNPLIQAQKLAELGIDPETIWKRTGWFKGADDRWKFEIDDSGAELRFNDTVFENNRGNFRTSLGAILAHPKLFEAYPDLRQLPVYLSNDMMIGNAGHHGVSLEPEAGFPPAFLVLGLGGYAPTDRKTLLSTLLHEVQHEIQDTENFATGGNVKLEGYADGFMDRAATGELTEFDKRIINSEDVQKDYRKWLIVLKAAAQAPEAQDLRDGVSYFTERLSQSVAFEAYRRLAGETEAREVQHRMGLGEEERRQIFPMPVAAEEQRVTFPWKDARYSDDMLALGGASDVTQTKAFKRWFGDSKVVDERGRPLVVYHGTNQDISSFAREAGGRNTRSPLGKLGFFFTSESEVAGDYAAYAARNVAADPGAHKARVKQWLADTAAARAAGDDARVEELRQEFLAYQDELNSDPINGQNVTPAYLAIENPMRVDGSSFVGNTQENMIAAVERAKAFGHDGMIFRDVADAPDGGRADVYVAFRPNQIKSAIGNRGSFDPNDDRIMFALGGARAIGAPKGAFAIAERRETQGRSPDQIWQELGVTRGPENKWRWEIDDSAAKIIGLDKVFEKPSPSLLQRLTGRAVKSGNVKTAINVPLLNVLSHPKLYNAYPFLRQMRVDLAYGPDAPTEGQMRSRDTESGGKVYKPIKASAPDAETLKSVLLHEIQHYIQQREGFATGSDRPRRPDYQRSRVSDDAQATALYDPARDTRGDDIRYWGTRSIVTPTIPERHAIDIMNTFGELDAAKARNAPQSEISELEDRLRGHGMLLEDAMLVRPEDYTRSAGETEAREVESRIGMTPEERRAVRPLADLPRDAIVGQNTQTRDYSKAYDAVMERAKIWKQIQDKWKTAEDIGAGVSVVRPSENFLVYGKGPNEPLMTFDLYPEMGSAVPEKYLPDALMALPFAQQKKAMDAIMKDLRTRNMRPALDHSASDDAFAFWARYDPRMVAFDPRLYAKEVEELAKAEYGEDATVSYDDFYGVYKITSPEMKLAAQKAAIDADKVDKQADKFVAQMHKKYGDTYYDKMTPEESARMGEFRVKFEELVQASEQDWVEFDDSAIFEGRTAHWRKQEIPGGVDPDIYKDLIIDEQLDRWGKLPRPGDDVDFSDLTPSQ